MKRKSRNLFSGRNIYLMISVAVLLALMIIGTLTLGPKFTEAAKDPDAFRELLGSGGIKSYFIFLCIQFAQIIFAFIPGEFIEVGAGYVYGGVIGTVLCLIGSAAATFVIFGLTRLLGRKFTSIMIDSRDLKRLKFLNNEKKLTLFFIILYFIPGTPKDLITYFAGVTKIQFGTFMLISTFCRIPSIITSTFAGSALGDERYLHSIIIFGVTGVVGVGGYFLYRFISRKYSDHKNQSSDKSDDNDNDI